MAEREKNGASLVSERVAWHSFPLGDVFAHLDSKREGLSSEESKNRLKHFGFNVYASIEKDSAFKIFLRGLINPVPFVLAAALAISAVLKNYSDAMVVFAALSAAAFFDFFMEHKLKNDVGKLASARAESGVLARRDGFPKSVSAKEIVPGDVIVLRAGDIVPADGRVIKCWGLETDESRIAGEVKKQFKSAGSVDAGAAVSERANIVLAGSAVSAGSGEAVVFDTGDNTEIASRQSSHAKNLPPGSSFLKARIKRLNWFASAAGLVLATSAFIIGLISPAIYGLRQDSIIVFLVVFLPLCLPLSVFLGERIAVKKIFKEHGSVKSTGVLETLGECGVILFDKSGTLTKGEPEVVKILTPERVGGIFEFNPSPQHGSNHAMVISYALLSAEVVAENISEEPKDWIWRGCAKGRAIIRAGLSAGLDWEKLNKKFKKVNEVPFSRRRGFSVSFRENSEGETWALALGWPDVLLGHVRRLQIINRAENLIPLEQAEIKETVDSLCRQGFEVMALCAKKIENKSSVAGRITDEHLKEIVSDLTLTGLLAFKDSLRPETREAIQSARRAGIKSVLLTQDHPLAALVLAREIGLSTKNKTLPEIMEGKDVESMDLRELGRRLRNVNVFCRVNSEHKLKILRAWQSQGESVVVVADGMEDALWMGQAKVAASLANAPAAVIDKAGVVLEKGLASLAGMIRESMVFTRKVRKIVSLFLAFSSAEAVFLAACFIFGYNSDFGLRQILFFNIFPLGLAVSALGLDKGLEKNRPLFSHDDAKKPFLEKFSVFFASGWGLVAGLAMFILFYFFYTYFESVLYARSAAFLFGGLLAAIVAFSAKTSAGSLLKEEFRPINYWLIFLGLSVLSAPAAVYLPTVNSFFGVQPVGFLEWVVMICVGAVSFVSVEIAKWIFNFYQKRSGRALDN